jgi:hypothetical protein
LVLTPSPVNLHEQVGCTYQTASRKTRRRKEKATRAKKQFLKVADFQPHGRAGSAALHILLALQQNGENRLCFTILTCSPKAENKINRCHKSFFSESFPQKTVCPFRPILAFRHHGYFAVPLVTGLVRDCQAMSTVRRNPSKNRHATI